MKVLSKKILLYILGALNLLVIFTFWRHGSLPMLNLGLAGILIAFGRLIGLFAVYAMLLQVLFIGRVHWLESVFGFDKLARVHHYIGIFALAGMIVHVMLLTIGYSILTKIGLVAQFLGFLTGYQYVLLSLVGLVLFIAVGYSSMVIIKRKMKYETWYFIHVMVYAAILLAYFHQLAVGGDFLAQPAFRIYWILLYIFVIVTLLWFRFIKPIYNFVLHRFKVEKIVSETHDTVSIYISGRDLGDFHILPGQFVIVRFLSEKFWWQAHPFSVSKHDHNSIRITVKVLGDYTKDIVSYLDPQSSVIIDGPYGVFTTARARKKKFLFIAGGIGVTPIKAMLEECKRYEWDATLLYSAKSEKDVAFDSEFRSLIKAFPGIKIHYILSEPSSGWKGEKGRINEEKIRRLVTDIDRRVVYLCGPAPMMDSMILLLRYLGVKNNDIHYERFSL